MTRPPDRLTSALSDRYRIQRELGQGGMATVYLAEDLRHDRKVALKVLRPELAAVLGADRFVQEIKTTAALQHPHILPLYDSGRTGADEGGSTAFLYYVMPFIQGETLREKLNRETQLGIEEAVRITIEVADALQYAHEQGVIHRDIKPENILVQNGRALVADFGIALAVSAAAGGRMTETGLSLGTPHYMSPEQATAEKNLTARSDVYSLGSVLYEMLAGEPPHPGNSAQQIIMKIVTDPARPVAELRKSVPPHVAAAVAKALETLPADRFATAAEFAAALRNPAFAAALPAGPTPRSVTASFRRAPFHAATTILVAALAVWGWVRPRPAPEPPVRRYVMQVAAGQEVGGWFRRVALSPDGARLAYLHEAAAGERQLFVLPRDQFRATELAGTGGAEVPFFSPDGARIGFVSPRGTIKVVPAAGGQVVPVATSGIGYAGATWSEDGNIYAHGSGGGLVRVPAGGGNAAAFTTLDTAAGEVDHVWPHALPGGRAILFVVKYREQTERSAIAVADATTGAYRILTDGLYAEYVSGHLIFAVRRFGPLMIQPFDLRSRRLAGEARVAAEGTAYGAVGAPDFVPDFTTSRDGTLIFTAGSDTRDTTHVVWVTRDGVVRPIDPAWTDQLTLSGAVMLSPDGRRLAVTLRGQIWIRQLDGGTMTQLTFDGGIRPEWTPDGTAVAYPSDREPGHREPFIRKADGTGAEEPLLFDPMQVHEVVFSPDGRWIVYRNGGGGVSDLVAMRRDGDTTRVPLVVTPYQEAQPVVSPDSRWLAYVTIETGRPQVRVRPFPNTSDGNWLVSPDGGTEPAWAHSGRELFYRDGHGNLVSVPVTPGPTFLFGRPRALFSARGFHAGYGRREYTVAPDDQRFVFVRVLNPPAPDRIVVVESVTHTGIARPD